MWWARLGMGLILMGSVVAPVMQAAHEAPRQATVEKILAGVKGRAKKGAESPFAFVSQTVVVDGHPASSQNERQSQQG